MVGSPWDTWALPVDSLSLLPKMLMATGKVLHTAGDEVYKWAQDCMLLSDSQLKARFPRLDREIAARRIRSCRKGRFGLLFQQQVEQERTRSAGMPNGCRMLRTIFRHFQSECDRTGMFAEQSLLNTTLTGGSLQDLDEFPGEVPSYAFTTIPDADLPRPSPMFNHLIDEHDKCPTLKLQRWRRPGNRSNGRIDLLRSGFGTVLTSPESSTNRRLTGV